jgi:hypothetical protein
MTNGTPPAQQPAQPTTVDKVLDALGASAGVRKDIGDLISVAGSIVSATTSIIGFVNTAQKVLQVLGLIGSTDSGQQQMQQTVQNIWNAVTNAARTQDFRDVIDLRGEVEAASDELRRTLNSQSFTKNDRDRLLGLYDEQILPAMHKMLGFSPYQRTLFVPDEYANDPWRSADPFFDPARWLVPQTLMPTPAATEAGPPFHELNPGDSRWDYRLFLPAVMELVGVMIPYMKALDPAFRTTGQFHSDIVTLRGFLTQFADNMTRCLQWTRDFEIADMFVLGPPFESPTQVGWPVGAVDICSGSAVVEPLWNDGVTLPPQVANLADSVARAATVRARKWQALYDASGIPELRNLIDQLTGLQKVPDSSETVQILTERYANRVQAGEASQHLAATRVCESRDFSATVYHVTRTMIMRIKMQPELYANFYAIPYEFWLESYTSLAPVLDQTQAPVLDWTQAVQRARLGPDVASLDIDVQLFDWVVEAVPFARGPRARPSAVKDLIAMAVDPTSGPIVRRYPGLDPAIAPYTAATRFGNDPDSPGIAQNYRSGRVTIDVETEFSDGEAVITLRNHPEQGSFAGLYLVVEETPGPQASDWGAAPVFGGKRVLRSGVEVGEPGVGMVGLEYHVPAAYFEYRKQCAAKAAALFNRIQKLAQAQQTPIPRWDPWQYESVGAYLDAVEQVSAGLIREARQ